MKRQASPNETIQLLRKRENGFTNLVVIILFGIILQFISFSCHALKHILLRCTMHVSGADVVLRTCLVIRNSNNIPRPVCSSVQPFRVRIGSFVNFPALALHMNRGGFMEKIPHVIFYVFTGTN